MSSENVFISNGTSTILTANRTCDLHLCYLQSSEQAILVKLPPFIITSTAQATVQLLISNQFMFSILTSILI